MQRKNRGEGTSLPMGELVKDPAALARLAQSGEARQLVSMLKQSGGVQEAAQAAADGDPGQLMQMMNRLLNTREGAELVSCPTCGRTRIDLIALAGQVEERLKAVDKPITVAVMGCVVNGPGEASAADCGIAGGVGEGLLFKKGQIIKKVHQDQLVDELFALIETL